MIGGYRHWPVPSLSHSATYPSCEPTPARASRGVSIALAPGTRATGEEQAHTVMMASCRVVLGSRARCLSQGDPCSLRDGLSGADLCSYAGTCVTRLGHVAPAAARGLADGRRCRWGTRRRASAGKSGCCGSRCARWAWATGTSRQSSPAGTGCGPARRGGKPTAGPCKTPPTGSTTSAGTPAWTPAGSPSMTAPHLSEYESWPGHGPEPSGRRPNPYLLAVLAAVYDCAVTDLIDLADRQHLPPGDLLILKQIRQQARLPAPGSSPGRATGGAEKLAGRSSSSGTRASADLVGRAGMSAQLDGSPGEPGTDDAEMPGGSYKPLRYQAGDALTVDAAGLPLRELGDHAVELGAWAEAGTAGAGTIAALEDEVASCPRR